MCKRIITPILDEMPISGIFKSKTTSIIIVCVFSNILKCNRSQFYLGGNILLDLFYVLFIHALEYTYFSTMNLMKLYMNKINTAYI